MTVMWQIETDTEGLLRVLSASPERLAVVPRSEFMPSRPPTRGLYLIWAEEPDHTLRLPNLIVTATGEVRPFVAWTSTYLDGFRPLTSLCRVIDWETFVECKEAFPLRNQSPIGDASALLTFAEALTLGRGKVSPTTVNISTCESTYSFCRARALAYGFRKQPTWLMDRWQLAREITRQPARSPTAEEIEPIWQVLCELHCYVERQVFESRSLIFAACTELLDKGSVSIDALQRLMPLPVEIGRVVAAMSETREERVSMFESLARSLSQVTGSHEPEMSFFLGYMASRLNPGSFEYSSLVASQTNEFPTLLMWYALCEAIHPNAKVLSLFGGVCRRILRDIIQRETLLERPQCDIALDEMDVLSGARGGLDYVRNATSSARVEIHPFITPTLKINVTGHEQAGLFVPREDERHDLIQHLQRAKDEIDSAYRQLRGATSERAVDPSPQRRKRGRH